MGPEEQPNPLAMYCLGCRYPLRGLTGDACPECGRRFDAHDPTTYSPTAKRIVLTVPFDAVSALWFAAPMLGLIYLKLFAARPRRHYYYSSQHLSHYYSNTLADSILKRNTG